MLFGSDPMPTALRAPTPASSPNTSAISSENPLITCGWSLKSSVQFTSPSGFPRRGPFSGQPGGRGEPGHFVERAEGGLHGREDGQPNLAGGRLALFQVQLLADLPHDH